MTAQRVLTEDEAFRLLAHLMATAELHTIEPPSYIHRRVVEGLLPLIDAMVRDGDEPSRAWLQGFRGQIEDALSARRSDPAAFEAFLRGAPGEITRELKRRRSRRAGKGDGGDGAARPR